MKGAIICSILILTTLAAFHFPTASASTPSGTIEGNYALHLKTTTYDDDASVSGPVMNKTIVSGSTYSFKASVFIVSGIGTAFEIRFLLFPYRSISLSFYSSSYSNPAHFIELLVGQASFDGAAWKPESWYNLEIRLTNDAGALDINGTQVYAFANAGISGLTIESMGSLSTGVIGEIYADGISVSQDDSVIYSEGFENGLSDLQVSRSGAAILDTVYFGQGTGLGSTLISLLPGSNRTYVNLPPIPAPHSVEGFGAALGSNLRVDGSIRSATSLQGVASASILVEVSSDLGSSFESIGSATSDQHGNFSVYWKPSKMGVTLVRAVYSGNCCFFGSRMSVYVDISRAISHISLSLTSSASLLGFSVGTNGTLTGIDASSISNANVLLEFTVPAATGWTTITSATTGPDGEYQATWLPQATGTFTIKASWAGSGTHRPTSTTATLITTSDGSRYIFSIASNATLSSPVYDSTAKTVSFTAQGPSGKTGYIDVTLPKVLVEDNSRLTVQVNGTDIPFRSTQSNDAVRLHFDVVFHSSYAVQVAFGGATPQGSSGNELSSYFLYGGITAVALLSIVVGARARTIARRLARQKLEG